MRALYKGVGTPIQTVEISNELHTLQQYVGGRIEPIYLTEETVLICNEEGKISGMQPNFFFEDLNDYIHGPVLFVGIDGDEFCDLDKVEADHIRKSFEKGEVRDVEG